MQYSTSVITCVVHTNAKPLLTARNTVRIGADTLSYENTVNDGKKEDAGIGQNRRHHIFDECFAS